MQDPAARERFAHPVPRIAEAEWLRDRGATAMIDLSDGLLGDAGHVAAASDLQCAIEIERVPVHPAVGASADALVSGEATAIAMRRLVGRKGERGILRISTVGRDVPQWRGSKSSATSPSR